MAIVPPTHAPHPTTDAKSTLHPELGVHDAMRHGLRSLHSETAAASYHPIQHRLEQWDDTQRQWKLTMQRNMFGMGAPMRTMMERHFVAQVRGFELTISPLICLHGAWRICTWMSWMAVMRRWIRLISFLVRIYLCIHLTS